MPLLQKLLITVLLLLLEPKPLAREIEKESPKPGFKRPNQSHEKTHTLGHGCYVGKQSWPHPSASLLPHADPGFSSLCIFQSQQSCLDKAVPLSLLLP